MQRVGQKIMMKHLFVPYIVTVMLISGCQNSLNPNNHTPTVQSSGTVNDRQPTFDYYKTQHAQTLQSEKTTISEKATGYALTKTVLALTPSLTPKPTYIPKPTNTPTVTPLPSPTPVPENLLRRGVPVKGQGPWLLFETELGVWLVSQDGRNIYLLESVKSWWKDFYVLEISLVSGLAASYPQGVYPPGDNILEFNSVYPSRDIILEVYSMFDNEIIYSLDLLAYDGEMPDFESEEEEETFIASRKSAVGDMAWSSDGTKLAFVSSHLGPSADLFVLDIETGEITRLTDRLTHAVNPVWSPDDRYILHGGVEKLWPGQSGYGYSGWTYYAARSDGTGVMKLFEGTAFRSMEEILGWINNNEVLMYTDKSYCLEGFHLINLETKTRHVIFQGAFSGIAYDSDNKTALVGGSSDSICNPSASAFLKLVDFTNGDIQEFQSDYLNGDVSFNQYDRFTWSPEINMFIVRINGNLHLVNSNGEISEIDGIPYYSPGGTRLALVGLGPSQITIIDKGEIVQEIPVYGNNLIWSRDGNHLYYFTYEHELFVASAPEFEPILVFSIPHTGFSIVDEELLFWVDQPNQ